MVAFVDDDHRGNAGYLEAMYEAAETWPEADLFCGRILPDSDGSEPAWVHDRGPCNRHPAPSIAGCILAARRPDPPSHAYRRIGTGCSTILSPGLSLWSIKSSHYNELTFCLALQM
jgi:hypothetical protein